MGEASTISKGILKPLHVDLKFLDDYIQFVIEDVEDLLLKAKIISYASKKAYRLPGTLAILAYKAVGGEVEERIIHGARGTSLFSMSGAAFDDVFDDYVEVGLKSDGIENSTTLCAAMISMTYAVTEVARACKDLEMSACEKIFRILENGLSSATYGFQYQNRNRGKIDMSEREFIEYVCKKGGGEWGKIGSQIGAILGGANDELVTVLGNFAQNLVAALLVYDDMGEMIDDAKYGFYHPPLLKALNWNETVVEALSNPPIDDVILDLIIDEKTIRHANRNFKNIIGKLLNDASNNLRDIPDSEAKDAMLAMVDIARELSI